MKKLTQYCSAASLILILTGCGSILPNTKREAATTKAVDSIASQQSMAVEKIVEITPPTLTTGVPMPQALVLTTNQVAATPTSPARTIVTAQPAEPAAPFTATGQGYRQTVRLMSGTGQTANSTGDANAASSMKLPVGVTWILAAVGIIALVVAVGFLKRSSPAAAAAINAAESTAAAAITKADTFFKSRIQALRDRAITSTDPATISQHLTEIAALESERGKLAKSA